MDCSPPGSSVHGILQARILEWVAILFSKGEDPGIESVLLHWQEDSSPLSYQGSLQKLDVPTNLLYNFLLEVTVEGDQMQQLPVAPKTISNSQPDCPLCFSYGVAETALASDKLAQG